MNITIRKQKIFYSMSKNDKPYWNTTVENYKDKQDKFTIFVSFSSKTPEPMPEIAISKSGTTYKFVNIEEAECSLGCYNGKPQLTIFSYKLAPTQELEQSKDDNSNMGGAKANVGESVNITQDELPFY